MASVSPGTVDRVTMPLGKSGVVGSAEEEELSGRLGQVLGILWNLDRDLTSCVCMCVCALEYVCMCECVCVCAHACVADTYAA